MDERQLSERKRRILKAIIDAHISNGEPVGSKYLAQSDEITCSPATIRNEMAELEDMGYLKQPHTSAGRVPSELGYRFYVDTLVRQYSATKSEIDEINEKLKYKLTEMDKILEEASKLAASFTDYTGIAFKTGIGQIRISKFDSVYLSSQDFLLVMLFQGDTVKAKPIHLPFPITEDDLRRFDGSHAEDPRACHRDIGGDIAVGTVGGLFDDETGQLARGEFTRVHRRLYGGFDLLS